ncbi:tRNA pseudouridine38-40 synthase [Candidatus Kryptobacter tengchongensis]|nr:tRNA pseudouridine38-40 synthase [Candidatus Kryptobacter tengchongensis]
MRNLKLLIEYDGTNFVGWQVQPNGRSVQGEIKNAIKKIINEEVNLIGASRTDAGVHARGQVANFKCKSKISTESLKKALNSILPDDIVIHLIEEVGLDFHARYDAVEKTYRYFITRNKIAIGRNYFWFVKYDVDFEKLKKCAELIIGEHDFEIFSKKGTNVKNYICYVKKAEWQNEGERLIFEITANRFLYGMVRGLVGAMIDVARGRFDFEIFQKILFEKFRDIEIMHAPACGLVLERVEYGNI